jgi:ferredoxin
MKKVIIEPGCISCGSCEYICPAVFKVTDKSNVIPDACLEDLAPLIKVAAQKCPVQVIKYEE